MTREGRVSERSAALVVRAAVRHSDPVSTSPAREPLADPAPRGQRWTEEVADKRPHARPAETWSARLLLGVTAMEATEAFHRTHQWHPESHFDLVRAAAGERSQPMVLAVEKSGQPCSIVVAQVVDAVVPWRVGYGTLGSSRARVLEVLRGGLLGDQSAASLEFVCDRLRASMRELGVDAIVVRHVIEGSAAHRVFVQRPGWFCRDRLGVVSANGRLTVPRVFAEFLAAQPKRERDDNRRYEKRIRREFGESVRVERLAGPADVERFTNVVESIARKTWQRGFGAGFRATPQERARWALAAERGFLRVDVLWLGDEPVAFCTGFAVGSTLWLEHIGYDPEYRRLRPGIFLVHRIVERLAGEGRLRAIDFGIGDAEYKRRLCDTWCTEITVWVFAPTVRGLWLNGVRSVTNGLYRLGYRVLERCGLLEPLKRRWRRALEPRKPDEFDESPAAG